jgi:hypothetical protein
MTGPAPDSATGGSRSLDERLQRLQEDVDFLLATRTEDTLRGSTTDGSWQAMSDGRAADAWRDLTDWVDELVDRYALDEAIPLCWYAHGAMVEELHALYLAWLGAFTGRCFDATARAVWHELLARTLMRIREWNRHGCAAGRHRTDSPAELTEAQCTERAVYVHADLQSRHGRDRANQASMS